LIGQLGVLVFGLLVLAAYSALRPDVATQPVGALYMAIRGGEPTPPTSRWQT